VVGDSTVVVAWVGGGGGSAGGAGEQVAWAFTRQSEPVRAAIVGGATVPPSHSGVAWALSWTGNLCTPVIAFEWAVCIRFLTSEPVSPYFESSAEV